MQPLNQLYLSHSLMSLYAVTCLPFPAASFQFTFNLASCSSCYVSFFLWLFLEFNCARQLNVHTVIILGFTFCGVIFASQKPGFSGLRVLRAPLLHFVSQLLRSPYNPLPGQARRRLPGTSFP